MVKDLLVVEMGTPTDFLRNKLGQLFNEARDGVRENPDKIIGAGSALLGSTGPGALIQGAVNAAPSLIKGAAGLVKTGEVINSIPAVKENLNDPIVRTLLNQNPVTAAVGTVLGGAQAAAPRFAP